MLTDMEKETYRGAIEIFNTLMNLDGWTLGTAHDAAVEYSVLLMEGTIMELRGSGD